MIARAYEVLGVDPAASDDQIRAAYRRLAQIYHPDRFTSGRPEIQQEAERRMMELNAAFAQICKIRPVRTSHEGEELPTGWRAAWDKAWKQEERWQAELERRRNEDQRRRAVHRRWEQIERITRQRANAWAAEHPSDVADGTPAKDNIVLPAATNGNGARKNQPVDVQKLRMNKNAVEAHQAAEQLRRTMDVDPKRTTSRSERG